MRKENENINFENGPWSAIENAWPDVRVVNKKEIINPMIDACVVYCPLYAPGFMSESELISYPDTIQDSRVAGKTLAYSASLKGISEYAKRMGGELNLKAVFANKGVIMDQKYSGLNKQKLAYHSELYKKYTKELCESLGINYDYFDYNDLGVEFPTFVGGKSLPKNIAIDFNEKTEPQLISAFNQNLNLSEEIVNNNKNRKVVKNIIRLMGVEGAYWLIAGYLVFDWKIASLVGGEGIYLVAERANSLFGISKLTKSLNAITRVHLSVGD